MRPLPLAFARFDRPVPHTRATPLLDQWVGPDASGASIQHRRSWTTQLGGTGLSVEGLRSRTLRPMLDLQGAATASKMVSIGLHADWALGTDRIWAGIAGVRQSFAQPDAIAGRAHLINTETLFGAGWQHGDHLRLNLDWLRVSGNPAAYGAERMAQLATGAPRREHGYRLALEWAPGGYGFAAGPHFGLEASSAQLAQSDASVFGTRRDDTRIGLFIQAPF
ncbi:hypothetical protein [Sphingomonas oryzagri]